jgi:2-dehydropantoate 2-reductase
MKIKRVALIGLGALGMMYGRHLMENNPAGAVGFVVDETRMTRYRKQGFIINGEAVQFPLVSPAQATVADLVVFAVKADSLLEAIQSAAGFVGPETVIVSLMNGVTSEEIIGRSLGAEKLLYCTAQGMDSQRQGNVLTFAHEGGLTLGEGDGTMSSRLSETLHFFNRSGVSAKAETDIVRQLWGKFMLNVGVNQTTVVFDSTYGGVCQAGPAHDSMVAAMEEVLAIARHRGINLKQEDIADWIDILRGLAPDAYPSMKQDVVCGRKTEVELFAGTVCALGRQYGIPTPVNDKYYRIITAIDSKR